MRRGTRSRQMTLAEAVERFRREAGAPSNSYDWYRQSAQKRGAVPIGGTEIKAWKENGAWSVDAKEFEDATTAHRERRAYLAKVSSDLSRGIIYGRDGDVIETSTGGYEIRGAFRLVSSDSERARHRSYGTWYCNRCNQPAETKHEKEECHRCADWNGCGQDCTLSEVTCVTCSARQGM
jgi:hypothetical protein